MAKSFHEWVNRASSWATIVTYLGFPAGGAGLMTYVAYFVSNMGVVTASLVFCLIFVSLLWTIIGSIWLIDRAEFRRILHEGDCEWGFSISDAVLNVSLQPTIAHQLSVSLANDKPFPLKLRVLSRRYLLNNTPPTAILPENDITMVVGAGKGIGLTFDSYGTNDLDLEKVIHGTCELHISYGRPSKPFTRKASFWMEISLHANKLPRMTETGVQFSFVGSHKLSIGVARDPVDEPYNV